MAAEKPVSIVGIGASAGGIEALEGLFRSMPADTDLAFIVVTHLPRGQHSSLTEIISRFTELPVVDAENQQRIQANRIHICPPDHVLTVINGVIHLQQRTSDMQRRPIDVFLSSLAETCGEGCVGILLSGGGTDGTLGIKAIKERGGFTLAQGSDGSAPIQSGMPDTAIAAGVVDLVVSVERMADRLAEYAHQLKTGAAYPGEGEGEGEDDEQIRLEICKLLLKQVGHDFSGYKQKTFMRRVRRRMQVLQLTSIIRYLDRLKSEPDEVALLFRDLLIGVTNFFRDPGAFDTLAKSIIPQLFENKGAGDSIRIWVPGCATGEEVYSIAIMFREYMDTLRAPPKIQIFATDIDEAALSVARLGRYPAPLMEHVSKERLKRFFIGDDVTYSVSKDIRDMCMFSPHSVIRDPPFSRIDLISCRNLLIYFGVDFQAQAIPVFHFALRPGGYLFLGTSENVSQYSDLFAPVDKKHRIFQRRDHVVAPLKFPNFLNNGKNGNGNQQREEHGTIAMPVRRAVETRVLERFAPAHVVVNRDGDVLHFSPRTGKYLEAPAGIPTRQLVGMARRGLRLDLRTGLREAMETRRPNTRENIAVELEDRVQHINLTIEPFGDNDGDPLYLVLFNDVGVPVNPIDGRPRGDRPGDETNLIERLEHELRDTRERLQATIEEYETAVEELKSSNEEQQSINEEMQSTNEELETSKEELQSVNEELQTVNSELNAKIEEVDRANTDLKNVFDSTQIATVFLDRNLVIRSFTPSVTGIFNLISSDRGRPLTDIVSHLEGSGDLRRDIQTVFEHGRSMERRVQRSDGTAHYLMRVLPYRGRNDVIDGALVTFVDVTKMVDAEKQQKALVDELNHRVRNILAVIGAIAKQTFMKSRSPEQFKEAFTGRLQSMARSYALVSREHWSDVKLDDILSGEFSSVLDEKSTKQRLSLEGPPVVFKPAAALSLGLIVHELVANAAKYGALSTPKGKVTVHWGVERNPHEALVVRWVESAGKKIAKPGTKGLGMELIERELKGSLGGTIKFNYEPKGLSARMAIPLDGHRFNVARK